MSDLPRGGLTVQVNALRALQRNRTMQSVILFSMSDEQKTLPTSDGPRKAALAFILITVTLDMLALGMIAPVLPRLVESFLGGSAVSTARMLGIFGTVWALMQFLASPLLGSLSDRFGRRPVILLSNFGLGFDYILMALAPTLSWLFVGRVISGITSATVPTALAYIADVTPPDKRAVAFGQISAAFGIGFVVGPAVGGILGNHNPRLPFWVAGALSLANAMYGMFVLPESLAQKHRGVFSLKRANPFGSIALLRRHVSVLQLSIVLFMTYLAHQVLTSVYVLYADYRYRWTDRTVGISLAVVGICSAIVGAGLVKPAKQWLGERGAMLWGLAFGCVGFAIFGLSQTGALFWFGIPIMNLWSLTGPAAQSFLSHHVDRSEQGQLQGALNSLRGFAGLIGPGLFTLVFSFAIAPNSRWHLPGAPFFLASAILVLSLPLAEVATRKREVAVVG
jgi:DHA1 family tetracycline resistance protein-like MFS transporter